MEVTFLGGSCVRLRGREADVVIDPPPGARLRVTPDVIVTTDGEADPARLRATDGGPQRVSGPGEYELRGVRITGIAEGATTVMRVEIDDVRVVAVGRLDRQLGEEAVETLGHVDVLAVPVGGGGAMTAPAAAKLVRTVEPANVVPIWYREDDELSELDPVDRFTKEMGLAEGWTRQPKLTLTGSSGSVEDTRVVVLEVRNAAG